MLRDLSTWSVADINRAGRSKTVRNRYESIQINFTFNSSCNIWNCSLNLPFLHPHANISFNNSYTTNSVRIPFVDSTVRINLCHLNLDSNVKYESNNIITSSSRQYHVGIYFDFLIDKKGDQPGGRGQHVRFGWPDDPSHYDVTAKEARKCKKFSKMASSSFSKTTVWSGLLHSLQPQIVLFFFERCNYYPSLLRGKWNSEYGRKIMRKVYLKRLCPCPLVKIIWVKVMTICTVKLLFSTIGQTRKREIRPYDRLFIYTSKRVI